MPEYADAVFRHFPKKQAVKTVKIRKQIDTDGGFMNKKRVLDAAIIFSGLIAAVLAYYYAEDSSIRNVLLILLAAGAVFFFVLFVMDGKGSREYGITEDRSISEIVLLNEEDEEIATWDIFGKISIVLGKQARDNHVDIDLKNTAYAGTVDKEHAVMNYYAGSWFIEDLDSENGVKIEKGREKGTYKVSSREPCRLEKNDSFYLGLTKLRVQ